MTPEAGRVQFVIYGGEPLHRFLSAVESKGELGGWSGTGQFKPGDTALFYFGKPHQSIAAVGRVSSKVRREKGRFGWTHRKVYPFCDFKPVRILENPVRLPDLASDALLRRWVRSRPYRNSRMLKPNVAGRLLSVIGQFNPGVLREFGVDTSTTKTATSSRRDKVDANFEEGVLREILVEQRSRSRLLRAEVIAAQGYTCQVCGFDFERVYGDLGRGYVEVHHLRALSTRRGRYSAAAKDLVVLCANCHRVIHRSRRQPLKPSALKAKLKGKAVA